MARTPQGSGPPTLFDRAWPLVQRFMRYIQDLSGIVFLGLALVTLLALIGLTSGAWITPWAGFIRRWLGLGSFFIVAGFAILGLLAINRQREPFTFATWFRLIAMELSALALIALFGLIGGHSLGRAETGQDGGLVGWGINEFISILLANYPIGMVAASRVLILGFIFILGAFYGLQLFGPMLRLFERWAQPNRRRFAQEELPFQPTESPVVRQTPKKETPRKPENRKVQPEFQKQFRVDGDPSAKVLEPPPRDAALPGLDLLLSEKNLRPDERHINQTAGLIEQTLAEFGIPSRVVGFQVGPTVTQFAVEPGYLNRGAPAENDEAKFKVRVSQISGLQRDLALALSAKRLRIQAPVPGRPYVGIEVPNERAAVVRMRPILESDAFYKLNSGLGVALGRDVSGQPVVADLVRMPHLLIAGTTGSGKSICIAALTVCLAMNNSPRDLRLVMIDPKMVEMVRFNGLPHLLGKVETDLERSAGVLRWVVYEMERRYKLLEELRSRDIESYNRKAARRKEYEHLPRIVVMIDELADLMLNAGEQTESTIVRLAQMARAVGIHMVVATQRPSTDVVTGLIKANFPARMSFSVASSTDSRVILDTGGAESLLGNGDMLFLPPEIGIPIRSQGVLITDQEIEKVIAYWQEAWQGEEDLSPWEKMLEQESMLADRDDLIEKAVDLIRTTGKASASIMQRRLRIGYPRAARLIDELEDLGVIGPSQGGGRSREIMIDVDGELDPNYDDED
jgi:S-DNA-T family DNA segregation ATPase FtsK/SpoIIIE